MTTIWFSKQFLQNKTKGTKRLYLLDSEDYITLGGVTYNGVNIRDGEFRFCTIHRNTKLVSESEPIKIVREGKRILILEIEE